MRYGAREEVGTGGEFMETYGLMIDGSGVSRTLPLASFCRRESARSNGELSSKIKKMSFVQI